LHIFGITSADNAVAHASHISREKASSSKFPVIFLRELLQWSYVILRTGARLMDDKEKMSSLDPISDSSVLQTSSVTALPRLD